MFGWGYIAEKVGWVQRTVPQEQAQPTGEQPKTEEAKAQAKPVEAAVALPTFTPSEGREVTVETPLYKAVLHSGGAILRSFVLNDYRSGIAPSSPKINLVDPTTAAVAPLGLLINGQPSWSVGKWSFAGDNLSVKPGQSQSLTFTGEVPGLRVVRELFFSSDSYLINERVHLVPTGEQPVPVRLGFTAGIDAAPSSGGQYDPMRIGWSLAGKFKEDTSAKDLQEKGVQEKGQIMWAGAMSNYFMAAILPKDINDITLKGRLQNEVYRIALEKSDIMAAPGQETVIDVSYWIGPKLRHMLEAAPNGLVDSIDLGMFSIIAKGLLWLLQFFHGYVHNWGVAIICLTILIKAAFWPLTAKSYSSMEKMKRIQPMMEAIKAKHADNKEQMNKEVMALYKTYGVNPASGCVPILVQLPVFFGLYQALLTAIELRHAPFVTYLPGTDFLWLADLSSKDPLYITPIIMGATMFLQQKMTPPAGDPTQQKIMMFLPLIFTVMFLGFPSGLVLYWLVNNVLSIAQQWMMLNKSSKSQK